MNDLLKALNRWESRRRAVRALALLPLAFIAAGALVVLAAGAARLWPLATRAALLWLALGIFLAALVLPPLVLAILPRRSLPLARRFDLLLGLGESISTALELESGAIPPTTDAIAAAQRAHTHALVADADARVAMPFITDWRHWAGAAAVAVVAALLIFLPSRQQSVAQARQAVEQAIEAEIEALEEMQEEVAADESLTAEEAEAITRALDEAIRELHEAGPGQGEAIAALSQARDTLSDMRDAFADSRMEALSDAAAESANPAIASASSLAELAEALDSLDLGDMTGQDLTELAETLSQMAESLAAVDGTASAALASAGNAVLSGDLAAAQVALSDAAESLAASDEMLAQLAQMLAQGGTRVAAASIPGVGGGGMGQAGQGAGSSTQSGQGAGGGGAGRGEGSGEGQGGVPGGDMATDNGPGDGGVTPFEELFAPQRIGGEGGDVVDLGDGVQGPTLGIEGDLVDNPAGEANVPYNEVYADYEGAVIEALESGYIPLGLRALIGQYFSGLDPG